MNISNLVIVAAILMSATLSAQTNTTKAYILYKGYPYVVYLSENGEITEFIRTAPEVMKGMNFDMNQPMPIALGPYVKAPVAPLPVFNSPLNTTVVGESEIVDVEAVATKEEIREKSGSVLRQEDMAQTSKVSEEKVLLKPKTAQKPMKTTVVRREKTAEESPVITRVDAASAIVDGSHILRFQGFSARLTPTLIDLLSDISKEYKANESKTLVITSFMTAGDNANQKLAENRMAACKDLLETYGIPADKMSTEIAPYDSSVDGNVKILFVGE